MRYLSFAIASLCCFVHASTVLVNDDMKKHDSEQWQEPFLFKQYSAIEYTPNGVIMFRDPKPEAPAGKFIDTAFEFKSIPKALPPDARAFDLSILIGTNRKSMFCRSTCKGFQNRIVWYDKDGKKIGEFRYEPNFIFTLDKPGWCTYRGVIPENARSAELHFGFDTPDFAPGEKGLLGGVRWTVGTADEIGSMAAMGQLPLNMRLISKSPTEDASAPIVIRSSNFGAIDWKKATVKLDDVILEQTAAPAKGVFTYKPDKPFNPGLHIFSVTVTDGNGNALENVCPFFIGAERRSNAVTVREDGMPLVDGKPFFMLGIACLVKQGRNGNSYENAFAEAEAAGMNFARHWSTYNSQSKDGSEYLAAAKRHNMYVSMSPTLFKWEHDIRRVAKGIAEQLDVERILAWDIGDDTSGNTSPEQLMAKHLAIHAIDTSRLTTQADGVGADRLGNILSDRSNYTPYVLATDAFEPEIYPVGNCNPGKETPEITASAIPMVTKSMKQIKQDWEKTGSGPRPIWPLIQYFYYDPASSRYWNRMPTHAELRAMSYLAVIHGSHGIFWYRYAGYQKTPNATRGYSDEEWKTLSSVSLEFRALYDMYCTLPVKQTQSVVILEGPEKDAREFDSINTLLKKHDGKTYLIVCNSAMKNVKASFVVPGAESGREYFEKRTLEVHNNAFTDEFGPFGVHVYELPDSVK